MERNIAERTVETEIDTRSGLPGKSQQDEPGYTNHDTSFSALARVEVLDENAGE